MNETSSLGIALSGGGHRATAFGLGVLLYLTDSGANQQVHTISSVSGGSILNAYAAIQTTPFNACPASEFEIRAAELAQLLSGNLARWIFVVRSAGLLFLGLSVLWAIAGNTALVLCLAAIGFPTIGVALGPRCGGTVLSYWLTWLYLAILSLGLFMASAWIIERTRILAWINTVTASSMRIGIWKVSAESVWVAFLIVFLLLWFALLQQRHAIIDIAFGHAFAHLPGSRWNPNGTLESINGGGIRHILCATELHGGQHAFFSKDLVYSRGFGIGGPGGLPLRTAVQLSANFPGGFPPRVLRTSRFRFELADPSELFPGYETRELLAPLNPVPRWMVLSDGGVFDNTADSWFLDVHERMMRLDVEFRKFLGTALETWEEEDNRRKGRLNYDEPTYTPEFREPFDAEHKSMIERLEAMKQMPERLVVVNAGKPEPWQSLWSVWIPFLGELSGFSKITSTMYNNTTSSRLRDLRARFASSEPAGAVVDIEEDPYTRVHQESLLLSSTDPKVSERQERARAVHEYFRPLLQSYEGPPGFEIPSQELEFITTLSRMNTAVATTLAPLGTQAVAQLMYHGYLQTMTTLHVEFGFPLLYPRPTLQDFFELADGRLRVKRVGNTTA